MNRKITAVIPAAVLLLSLVPLVILAFYARPAADDYGYGTPVHYALRAGAGIGGIIKAVIENVKYTYFNWQGTFSSVILFSVHPGVFSEKLYFITPFIYISAITASVFLPLFAIRNIRKREILFLGSVISFLAVQYLPSAGEGIYWWNGASHYIAFFCLSAAALTLRIRLSYHEKISGKFIVLVVVSSLCAFFVGGGNYSQALTFALVSVVLTIITIAKHRPGHVIVSDVIFFVCACIGLVISVIAPGNAVRQAGYEQMTAVRAVTISIVYAWMYICEFTDLKIIAGLLLCVPVFLPVAARNGWRFRAPLPVVAAAFLIYASFFTPVLYAMGIIKIAGRIENMFWLAYLFFMFGTVFYLSGFIYNKFYEKKREPRILIKRCTVVIGIAAAAAALVTGFDTSNAFTALSDIRDGKAEVYKRERVYYSLLRNGRDAAAEKAYSQHISEWPESFKPEKNVITWTAAVKVNGRSTDLPCHHICGGEVSYVPFDAAAELLGGNEKKGGYTAGIYIGGEYCVPLREACKKAGYETDYDPDHDAVYLNKAN